MARWIRRDGAAGRLDRGPGPDGVLARPPTLEEFPGALVQGTPAAPIALLGLKVREALQAHSFWLIAAAQLLLSTAWIGIGAHLIPYLIGIGWTPTVAAEVVSLAFVFSAAGNFFVGALTDRSTSAVRSDWSALRPQPVLLHSSMPLMAPRSWYTCSYSEPWAGHERC